MTPTVRHIFAALLAAAVAPACSFAPASHSHATVRLSFARDSAARSPAAILLGAPGRASSLVLNSPSDVNGFACYAVNISGDGLDAQGSITPDPSYGCSYLAASSTLVDPSTGGDVSLDITSGAARRIQVIGIADPTDCASADTLGNEVFYWEDLRLGGLFNLGMTITDVFTDTDVTVNDSYVPGQQSNPFACDTGGQFYDTPGVTVGWQGGTIDQGFNTSVDALDTVDTYAPDPTTTAPGGFDDSIGPTLTNLDKIGDPTNDSKPVWGYSGNDADYPRLDLLFDTSDYDLTTYTAARIELRVNSGVLLGTAGSISSCAPTASTTFSDLNDLSQTVSIAIWNETTSEWEDANGYLTAVNADAMTGYDSASGTQLQTLIVDVNPETLSDYEVPEGNGYYIHLSVRGDTANVADDGGGNSECSAVAVTSAQLFLVP